MKSSDNLPDNKSSSSDWDYSYILSWISNATRMNKQEFDNWREIKGLQRLNPNFINRYLGILKSEKKVQKMEMQNINKKRELLKLLNDTEKRIIAEIVKGTDFDKIYQKVGISSKTFPNCMSGIYKKTRDIIPYENRIKRTALKEYFSQESASEQKMQEAHGGGEPAEQSVKAVENKPVDFGIDGVLECLKVSRAFLEGKYKKSCEELGDLLVQSSTKAALDSQCYIQAKNYDDAIFVLRSAIKELEGV